MYAYTPSDYVGGLGCNVNGFHVIVSRSSQGDTLSYSINDLTEGEFYSIKVQFTGTQYIISLSSDGETWVVKHTENSETNINPQRFIIGAFIEDSNSSCNSPIDLEGCYIKINGEYWWKGVETL